MTKAKPRGPAPARQRAGTGMRPDKTYIDSPVRHQAMRSDTLTIGDPPQDAGALVGTRSRRRPQSLRSEAPGANVVAGASDWRQLVDGLPVCAIYLADGHVHMNRAAELLTGYERGELATMDAWFTKLYADRAPVMRARHEYGRQHGFPDSLTATIRRKDGTEREIEFSAAAHGNSTIAVMRDVTESRALQRQVLDLVNQEQRIVGQELHDGVLQDLTGLGLLAASLVDELPPGSAARQRADKLAAGISSVNRTVQQLAEGMVPHATEAGDLQSSLQLLAVRTTRSQGLNCQLSSSGPVHLDDRSAHELYRVAQEAVANSVRHARARNITIELAQISDTITLQVLDDGIGIDERRRPPRGLGMQIMKYRCSLLGGKCSIACRPEGGTRVSCVIRREPQAVPREP